MQADDHGMAEPIAYVDRCSSQHVFRAMGPMEIWAWRGLVDYLRMNRLMQEEFDYTGSGLTPKGERMKCVRLAHCIPDGLYQVGRRKREGRR
jgi:hypothetical protein